MFCRIDREYTDKMATQIENKSGLETDAGLSKKEKRRLSVNFTSCININIPDEAGSKSSLCKK